MFPKRPRPPHFFHVCRSLTERVFSRTEAFDKHLTDTQLTTWLHTVYPPATFLWVLFHTETQSGAHISSFRSRLELCKHTPAKTWSMTQLHFSPESGFALWHKDGHLQWNIQVNKSPVTKTNLLFIWSIIHQLQSHIHRLSLLGFFISFSIKWSCFHLFFSFNVSVLVLS